MYEILRFGLRFIADIGEWIGEFSIVILNLFPPSIFAMSADEMMVLL